MTGDPSELGAHCIGQVGHSNDQRAGNDGAHDRIFEHGHRTAVGLELEPGLQVFEHYYSPQSINCHAACRSDAPGDLRAVEGNHGHSYAKVTKRAFLATVHDKLSSKREL